MELAGASARGLAIDTRDNAPMSDLRVSLRRAPLIAGCAIALLFGLAHIAGHFVFFGPEQPRADLAAGRTAMLAATIETAGVKTTRWDLFLFFSLSLSVGCIAFGTLALATLRASGWSLAVGRAVAGCGLAFGLALLGTGAAHSVLQPIVAGGLLTPCFAIAWRPRRT